LKPFFAAIKRNNAVLDVFETETPNNKGGILFLLLLGQMGKTKETGI
jgi:hypothetical protein